MKKYLFILVMSLMTIINANAYGVKPSINIDDLKNEKISNLLNNDSIIIKNTPIERYLDIKNDQRMFFKGIHEDVCNSIDILKVNKENGTKEFIMHLNNDLNNSRMVLDHDQMRKYLLVLNVTLNNNDLIKYINE